MMSDTPEWTTAGQLMAITADELGSALNAHGIALTSCFGNADGFVELSFRTISDAEAMLSLAVDGGPVPGSLSDRVASSCVSLQHLAEFDEGVSDEQVDAVIRTGWVWQVHPAMNGRVVGWHVSVDIPVGDANTVTANLNTLRNGGSV